MSTLCAQADGIRQAVAEGDYARAEAGLLAFAQQIAEHPATGRQQWLDLVVWMRAMLAVAKENLAADLAQANGCVRYGGGEGDGRASLDVHG